NLLDSQPVIGVATAVATRLRVITQEISSCVADRLPRICGSTRLASVMVMPNSMLASCTISRMSHCRALIVKMPPCSAIAVISRHFLVGLLALSSRFRSRAIETEGDRLRQLLQSQCDGGGDASIVPDSCLGADGNSPLPPGVFLPGSSGGEDASR